jgi:hypothetical protein
MRNFSLAAALAAVVAFPAMAQEAYVDAGSELALGEAARVPHLVPNGPEVPIELTITAIENGSMDDLAGFQIPADLQNARPVYVRYEYENASDEDLSNQQIGAFVAIDDRDQAHAPALAMAGGFDKCTANVPGDLQPGQSAEGCVMFMLHEDGQIAAAAYRGHYRDESGTDTQAKYPIYYNPVKWTVAEAGEAQPSGGVVVQ